MEYEWVGNVGGHRGLKSKRFSFNPIKGNMKMSKKKNEEKENDWKRIISDLKIWTRGESFCNDVLPWMWNNLGYIKKGKGECASLDIHNTSKIREGTLVSIRIVKWVQL